MMTNPTVALLDDDRSVRYVGTLETVKAYLDGYADAVMEQAWEEYEAEVAFNEYLSHLADDRTEQQADHDNWDDDNDEFLAQVVNITGSLAPVVLSAAIDEADQDNTAAYADILVDGADDDHNLLADVPNAWEVFLATGATPDDEPTDDQPVEEEPVPAEEALEPVS